MSYLWKMAALILNNPQLTRTTEWQSEAWTVLLVFSHTMIWRSVAGSYQEGYFFHFLSDFGNCWPWIHRHRFQWQHTGCTTIPSFSPNLPPTTRSDGSTQTLSTSSSWGHTSSRLPKVAEIALDKSEFPLPLSSHLCHVIDNYRKSLVYMQLFHTLARMFRPGSPTYRLHETTVRDVVAVHGLLFPLPPLDSNGVRVKVS